MEPPSVASRSGKLCGVPPSISFLPSKKCRDGIALSIEQKIGGKVVTALAVIEPRKGHALAVGGVPGKQDIVISLRDGRREQQPGETLSVHGHAAEKGIRFAGLLPVPKQSSVRSQFQQLVLLLFPSGEED